MQTTNADGEVGDDHSDGDDPTEDGDEAEQTHQEGEELPPSVFATTGAASERGVLVEADFDGVEELNLRADAFDLCHRTRCYWLKLGFCFVVSPMQASSRGALFGDGTL